MMTQVQQADTGADATVTAESASQSNRRRNAHPAIGMERYSFRSVLALHIMQLKSKISWLNAMMKGSCTCIMWFAG